MQKQNRKTNSFILTINAPCQQVIATKINFKGRSKAPKKIFGLSLEGIGFSFDMSGKKSWTDP